MLILRDIVEIENGTNNHNGESTTMLYTEGNQRSHTKDTTEI